MALLEAIDRAYNFGEKHPKLVKRAFALGKVSHRGAEIFWKSEPNKISALSYNGPPKKTATLVVPGFGSLSGKLMAQDLQQTPFGDQQILYCQYDNTKGANNKMLAKQLVQLQEQLGFESLDVYAPSMGFLHALEIAMLAGVPLRNVLATGSPSHVRDARAGRLGHIVAEAMPYDFRMLGKLTSTFIADSAREGMKKTPTHVAHAVEETFRGSSTMLLRSQMKFLGRINILKNWHRYKHVIIPGFTQFGYAAPTDKSDTTVHTEKGFLGVREFARNFRSGDREVPLTFIPLREGAGHANTPLTLEAATSWMKKGMGNNETIIYQKAA